MVSLLAKKLASKEMGPTPSFGFGPGAVATVKPSKEGGPGSGPSGGHEQSHRGARIYSSGNAVRALTPSGHNIGPFKNADLLKSHLDKNDTSFGLTPKQHQADSGTSVGVPQLRPQKKESNRKSKTVIIKEAQDSPDLQSNGSLFQVALIKEGLGNFRDRFYYTKQALQGAVQSGLFEGAQSYADHPSTEEEEIRPERSTRDILGYYENVQYVESESGQGQLIANLNLSKAPSLDWARELLTNAIQYSKKFNNADLVGLSINASGAAIPMNIDEFMTAQNLSPEVIQKLNEAKAEGVSEINIVNELKEAQSVDLVTKAGAGGRILQMLEQEKRMYKNKFLREAEKEAMEKKKMEDGGQPAMGDGQTPPTSAGTPDHADAAQDQALFAQMIKQYLGKDDGDAEEMEMAKEAYQCHKEAGMEHKEAYEAAGQHLKMAMAIGKKMAQKQASKTESETEETEEADSDGTSPIPKKGEQTVPTNAGTPTNGKSQESMKYVALSGEVAKLRESLRRYELRDYLDEKCHKSGETNSVTKKFREALGVPKSREQIDSTWKIFIKAFKAGVEEVSTDFSDGMFNEKNYRESSDDRRSVGFADCLR